MSGNGHVRPTNNGRRLHKTYKDESKYLNYMDQGTLIHRVIEKLYLIWKLSRFNLTSLKKAIWFPTTIGSKKSSRNEFQEQS